VLVFVERRGGEIKRPSLQAVSAALELARSLGGRIDALALGPGAAATAAELAPLGVSRVLACSDGLLDLYAPEAYVAVAERAVAAAEAAVVLLAATSMGKDLAPRLAARLRTAAISDAVEVACDPDLTIRARRPVFSGKAIATVAIPSARPAVVSLRPNVFPVPEPSPGATAEVVELVCPVTAADVRAACVRLETPAEQELDVAEASMIVSGGRGLKDPANFALVRDLADALGAAVGASRAVVDAGWIPHSHQVGQTGKVVSPNLYIAVGISGAIQHLAGMSSSRRIVAINKDPEAPIFKVADYGIVGDLFEVVPRLTAEIRKIRS